MSAVSKSAASEEAELDFVRWERLEAVKRQVMDAVGAHAIAANWLERGDTERALEEVWMQVQWDGCLKTKTTGLPGLLTFIESDSESDRECQARTIGALNTHLGRRLQDKLDVGDFMTHHSSVTLDDLSGRAHIAPTVEEIVVGRSVVDEFTQDANAAGPETAKYLGSVMVGGKNISARMAAAGLEDYQYRKGRKGSVAVLARLRERVATILLWLIPAAVMRRWVGADNASAASTTDAAVVASGAGGGAAVAMKVGAATAVATASIAGVTQAPKLVEPKAPPARVQVSKAAPTMKRAMDKSTVTLRSASTSTSAPKARVKTGTSSASASKKSTTTKKRKTRTTSSTNANPAEEEFAVPTYTGGSSSSKSSAPAAQSAPVPSYTPPKKSASSPAANEFDIPTADSQAPAKSPADEEFK